MSEGSVQTEEYRVTGEGVVAKVKELVHKGNIRRVIIQNEDDRTLLEVPLTLGVVGAIMLPTWAAIGAIAALVSNCTIVVERAEDSGEAGSGDLLDAAPPVASG